MDGPDSIHWKAVAEAEILSEVKNNTWILTPRVLGDVTLGASSRVYS
jgi:hypothetical protein